MIVSFFCMWLSIFLNTSWGCCIFPIVYPCLLFWRLMTICSWIDLGFSVLFHSSLCLFLCQYDAVLIINTLTYSLKSGSMIPPALFFFKIALATWDLCDSTHIFKIICFSSVKNAMSILIGISLSSDCLR